MRTCAVVAAVALLALSGCRAAPEKARESQPQSVVEVRLPAGARPDLITSLAVCRDRIVMGTTPRAAEILLVDRQTGRTDVVSIRQGQPATREPYALGVDCERDSVFVIDRLAGLSAISMTTGSLVRTYPMPDSFVPSLGTMARISRNGESIVVAGYWLNKAPSTFFSAPVRTAFVGLDLGVRFSLSDGATSRMFTAAGTECLASFGPCGTMPFDNDGDGWILGDSVTPSVRMMSDGGKVATRVALASPRYSQSAAPVESARDREERTRWEQTFSSVHAVYSFGSVVAVAHRRLRQDAPGGIGQFDVFLNIGTRDGTPIRSDVPLLDLPVGRDETGIFAINYGPGGRQTNATTFTIVRYDVSALVEDARRAK